MKKSNVIQPHCGPCGKSFWKDDLVQIDTMFEQIQHIDCFAFQKKYIKETGNFGEIVSKHPIYKRNFLVLERGQTLQ
ncbi:hypothetical protein [Cytobacillus firmus]|uniref:hypothetical protein n=1 Tax=Cytobacillus firmus TaxID=1399 RepID=UPI0021C8A464|nr:hypothetical protein [Cytobacillus firmus]MCU1808160.1 hypothetical protein [Cytobacillus firmus]